MRCFIGLANRVTANSGTFGQIAGSASAAPYNGRTNLHARFGHRPESTQVANYNPYFLTWRLSMRNVIDELNRQASTPAAPLISMHATVTHSATRWIGARRSTSDVRSGHRLTCLPPRSLRVLPRCSNGCSRVVARGACLLTQLQVAAAKATLFETAIEDSVDDEAGRKKVRISP